MQRRTETWRQCIGLCCICGQPMASPQFRGGGAPPSKGDYHHRDEWNAPLFEEGAGKPPYYPAMAYSSRRPPKAQAGGLDAEAVDGGGEGISIDSDGKLLTEEEPTRMALMRFNALGEFQFAHVVDDYTFLEGRRNGVSFRTEFAKHKRLIRLANPDAIDLFQKKVLEEHDARVYDAAVTTNRRIAENLTIPSCKRCNKAMDREGAHVTATYRCFPVTQQSDVPNLEGTSKEAIAAKKVIQQIAFYFSPVLHATGNTTSTSTLGTAIPVVKDWKAKDEDWILRDAVIWRCVAHLWNWGRSAPGGGVRFRMIAVFHASHYIYLGCSARELIPFETWHVHIWRPFYMAHYSANTFLGMRQYEVGQLYDLSRKDGFIWERLLKRRAESITDAMEAMHDAQTIGRVIRFEEEMTGAGVHSEATLLQFMSNQEAKGAGDAHVVNNSKNKGLASAQPKTPKEEKQRAQAGISRIMEYFRYNLSGGSSGAFLLRQCDALERELLQTMLPHSG